MSEVGASISFFSSDPYGQDIESFQIYNQEELWEPKVQNVEIIEDDQDIEFFKTIEESKEGSAAK